MSDVDAHTGPASFGRARGALPSITRPISRPLPIRSVFAQLTGREPGQIGVDRSEQTQIKKSSFFGLSEKNLFSRFSDGNAKKRALALGTSAEAASLEPAHSGRSGTCASPSAHPGFRASAVSLEGKTAESTEACFTFPRPRAPDSFAGLGFSTASVASAAPGVARGWRQPAGARLAPAWRPVRVAGQPPPASVRHGGQLPRGEPCSAGLVKL